MAGSCPLCSEPGSHHHLEKNGFTLVRCLACGLIYVNPMPEPAALRAHYANPAYFAGQDDQGYADYAAAHKALRPHFDRRLDDLAQSQPAGGRLLDFGCADGYFLQMAKARGWKVAGVELSAPMASQAAQTLAAPVVTDLADLGEASFDALTLWEVIEHMPEPLAALQGLHARLRPGGVILLSTPNTGHWQAQRAPDRWVSYRPPSHLVYFTAQTLEAALARAGFASIRIRRVMPLPPLPGWLDRRTRSLQSAIAAGTSANWPLTLLAWRAVRLFGWALHSLARSGEDVYATLEAAAVRSK